jgi:hypothetical protein
VNASLASDGKVRFFLPATIKKVLSDGSLIVEGCASVSDYIDDQNDIPDADALERAMTAWSPFGNIRGQHDPKWPIGTIREPLVGKLSEDLKPGWWMGKHPVTKTPAAYIRAHIVDDKAVKFFRNNLFSGFSIGGEISPGGFRTEQVTVNGVKKTIRRLTDFSFAEISAVDKPACDLALVESVSIAKRGADESIRTVADAVRYANSIIERSRRKYGVPQTEVNKVLQKAEEFDPRARPNSQTPPEGTSARAIAAARVREEWPKIGQHLGAAMRANPGSREIGDAGQTWAALDQVGLGIDSRFMTGTFSVPVSPDGQSTDLQEAWAHSTGDKMAMAQVAFRKSYAKRQPMIISKVGGQVVLRSFAKSAGEAADEGGSEAAQLLRRHSLETALAHMKILSDKIKAAMEAVGSDSMAQPHLSSAHLAATEAKGHLQRCLNEEDDK